MINLFYVFNKASLELYQSFKNARLSATTVVVEDSGFLPADIQTPYLFFSDFKVEPHARPKFFNEIKVPEFWEIHGSNQVANIYNLGEVKANIQYHSHPQPRAVHKVEWLDKNSVRFVDIYNQYGHRFSQEVYSSEGKRLFKSYYNQKNEEIIYENLVTQQVILKWKQKEYIFDSKTKFVQFYLEESGMDDSVLNINSLGIPYFVSIGLGQGHTNLIWQEQVNDNIPGNMLNMLSVQNNRTYALLIPDRNEYERVISRLPDALTAKVKPFGYVYHFKRNQQYSKNVLIATNSDQLINFAAIAEQCPEYTFHIVAITEMSNTLIQYDQYKNVKLYPKASKATFNHLFEICDVYLDINKGNELHSAVRRAFNSNLIIFSFVSIAHNKDVILKEHIFEETQVTELTRYMNQLTEEQRDHLIELQHRHANHIKISNFIDAIK
ncbi:accessory Sec system glycosylation chaperone GtfB [Macrococcoides canis]|uniref:accessory Sec system glycosylation chaperone GtfB n=1 Tax=Macrococcoides canis TaxID=1855823 RepID=UPI0013E8FF9C|nr:accessory Sec system glycosylation chaperone GtfB [Macrococcus canis]QIH76842.1 accessory Sec system glycosylation chaperone GtfB [Macrococcus canis]UTG99924.1 accessory Sec system glycosylation chaperone GtfB [Macrococcus canis]WBF53087.1 accessory Sec system glycosylation chaperone GtfB [Macrococcus canis]